MAVGDADDLDSIVEDVEEQSTTSEPTHAQFPRPVHSVRAKLPKLEVKKFNGNIKEWRSLYLKISL